MAADIRCLTGTDEGELAETGGPGPKAALPDATTIADIIDA